MSDDDKTQYVLYVARVSAELANECFNEEEAKDGRLEATVDADIARFEQYFQSLGNEALMGVERAIIKTYLHYKLKGPRTNGP